MLRLSTLALSAGLLGAAGPALAVLPYGTLSFVEQFAEVAPDQVIDVRVRLTIDPNSPALDFSSEPLTGIDPADLPTEGYYFNPDTSQYELRTFASIDGARLNTYFTCNDTFTGACNGDTSNYSYSFFLASEPGKPSVNFQQSFQLAPGASYEYVFAQFTPAAGGAAPGTYKYYNTGLTLEFFGTDENGDFISTFGVDIAATCPGFYDESCAFTRTVVAIPEPGTYALMALGLAGVLGSARRRRAASAS